MQITLIDRGEYGVEMWYFVKCFVEVCVDLSLYLQIINDCVVFFIEMI